MEIALGYEEADIDKVYQEMQADSYSISIGVVLLYESVLDSSKQYKSTLNCDIKKQIVTIKDKNMT